MKLLIVVTVLIHTFVKAKRPNILMIVVDDLRPALGVYGDRNAYSPNIDQLAARSFVFERAYAQQALCAPSRNSLLTSRRPDSLHLYDFYSYWRREVGNFTTIPQHFKQNGYITHSIGKVFHPGESSNCTDDYPISWTKPPFHPRTDAFKDAKVCVNADGTKHANLICPVRIEDQPFGTLPDIEVLDEARKFLSQKYSKPYFLAVGFHKPHIPLKYPVEYLEYHPIENVTLPTNTFIPPGLPTVTWNPWIDFRKRDDIKGLNITFPFGHVHDEMNKAIVQSYSAAVSYIDDLIGRLVRMVDNETIIILFGDHGVSLGEHGEFGKYSNTDIATRVPLIINVPGLTCKTIRFHNQVELLDIFPTLVDLSSVSSSLNTCEKDSKRILCTEGRSLVPEMFALARNKRQKIPNRAIFTQYPRPGIYPTMKPNSDEPRLGDIRIMGYSVRTDSFRFTDWIGFDHISFGRNWSVIYATELYDLLADPQENNNIADRPGLESIVSSLRETLMNQFK